MSELEIDQTVVIQNNPNPEIEEIIRKIKTPTIAEFKPVFEKAGEGPLYSKYPDSCTVCHAEHSVTKNGTICADCMKKMSFNRVLNVFGGV